MNTRVIEANAIDIITKVKDHSFQEDALVELKADWPEPQKAARRLAGHANAARGEPILWIIGIDQDTAKCSLSTIEIADWWAIVKSCFQGSWPEMKDIVLRTENEVFQLLWFDTTNSPYVVKNPNYGNKDAGPVEREVPWRQGTAVRTATREDLLLMLVPRMKLPEIEVLASSAYLARKEPESGFYEGKHDMKKNEPYSTWSVSFALYIAPMQDQPCVLPVHRTSIEFQLNLPGSLVLVSSHNRYTLPVTWGNRSIQADSNSIQRTESEAIIHLPGKLHLNGTYDGTLTELNKGSKLNVAFSIRPVGTDFAVQRRFSLDESSYKSSVEVEWKLA